MTGQGVESASAAVGATFELERFAWRSPAQLELAGRFAGLGGIASDGPVLVVSGEGGTHRLPAVSDSLVWPPDEGQSWQAAFAWEEPPAPFDAVELELAAGLVVDLPAPGYRRPRFGRRALKVRAVTATAKPQTPTKEEEMGPQPDTEAVVTTQPETETVAPEPETEAVAPQQDTEAPTGGDILTAPSGIERVRLQADLVAAQEEVREARAASRAAQEELTRAREALESERDARAREAARFREGLESVSQVAEETIAAERATAERLSGELEDARGELAVLREQVEALEASGQTVDQLRQDLEVAERQGDDLRAQLARAEHEAEEHRSEREGLRRRLEAIRSALDEAG